MSWSDYWGALGARQRKSLIAGGGMVLAAALGAGAWLLNDPYVPLASHMPSDRLAELTQQLDRAKIRYRVEDDAESIAVPESQAGAARAAMTSGDGSVPASAGLELFKDTDFSSTDFVQRINYQRALQGELTRTIQTISGVRSVRVHVVLPDTGVFKRSASSASAAISLSLRPGSSLSPVQVRGIQRLVVASVPDIKIDDVVVLDESGTSLTRAAASQEGDMSSAQLDMKRQADQYLETKVRHLLQDLAPDAGVSLSVDALLDDRQLRVTTEQPIAASSTEGADHSTGVITKERQAQRTHAPSIAPGASDAADLDSSESDYEYKVGNRLEQVLSAPGSIKRITVAVALLGAPADISSDSVERLVGHAVGVDPTRGDSVAVVLLPRGHAAIADAASTPRLAAVRDGAPVASNQRLQPSYPPVWMVGAVATLTLVSLLSVGFWLRGRNRLATSSGGIDAGADLDAATAKVRQWISEGANHDRG